MQLTPIKYSIKCVKNHPFITTQMNHKILHILTTNSLAREIISR